MVLIPPCGVLVPYSRNTAIKNKKPVIWAAIMSSGKTKSEIVRDINKAAKLFQARAEEQFSSRDESKPRKDSYL